MITSEKNFSLSYAQAAGSLLLFRGQEKKQTHVSECHEYEERLDLERREFYRAQREAREVEKTQVRLRLAQIQTRAQARAQVCAHETQVHQQMVIRHDNGDKYEGGVMEVVALKSVKSSKFSKQEQNHRPKRMIPHGKSGTLWIPQDGYEPQLGHMKLFKKYTGSWFQGQKHGQGIIYWASGHSWEGMFCQDELHGKGLYTTRVNHSQSHHETSEERYYWQSRHVCWKSQLNPGTGIRLLPTVATLSAKWIYHSGAREETKLDRSKAGCIVEYDPNTDQHLIEYDIGSGSRASASSESKTNHVIGQQVFDYGRATGPSRQWICLAKVPFEIDARPKTRWFSS